MEVIDFQAPSPSFTSSAFSVWRYPRKRGAACGSCFRIAWRYWSSEDFKQARSQVAPSAGSAAADTTARTQERRIRDSPRTIVLQISARWALDRFREVLLKPGG